MRVERMVSQEQFECALGIAESWQRQYEAKYRLMLSRLQKRVEELEKAK